MIRSNDTVFDQSDIGGSGLYLRLNVILGFLLGFGMALTESSLRRTVDLPLVEGLMLCWALVEIVLGRCRVEDARKEGVSVVVGLMVLFAILIGVSDYANDQALATTIRNILKYEIFFVVLLWMMCRGSIEAVGALLLGALVAVLGVGLSILWENAGSAAYLAKYSCPYIGIFYLAALARGRPINGALGWIAALALMLGLVLASFGHARWAMISFVLTLFLSLMPRTAAWSRSWLLVLAVVLPIVPLLTINSLDVFWAINGTINVGASEIERALLYIYAGDMMREHSLTGIGFETFLAGFSERYGHLLRMEAAAQGPHNQYAALGSIFGVPALVTYALMILAILRLYAPPGREQSRLFLPCIGLITLMFSANEVADTERLSLYLAFLVLLSGHTTGEARLLDEEAA